MPGDRVRVRTWVAQSRRVLSTRHYEILRAPDGVRLATGHTDWVLIDVATGRPTCIPPQIVALFDDGDGEPSPS
jgi:acyl-CoA thioester hydrolase